MHKILKKKILRTFADVVDSLYFDIIFCVKELCLNRDYSYACVTETLQFQSLILNVFGIMASPEDLVVNTRSILVLRRQWLRKN